MVDYNEINDFIIKVFNYYNGKINVINKAVLDINWANLMCCSDGGYSRLPNIVVINPSVIIRFYNNNEAIIKLSIIETIIHELYHTDQLINYNLYTSDANYNKSVEYACEIQTIIYVTGHMQEICNTFGLNLQLRSKSAFDKQMSYWDLPGVRYQRRYYHDHIFMCIDDMCSLDQSVAPKIYQIIKDNISEKRNTIININNEQIKVCYNGILISMEDFNNIISKYMCTGVHKTYNEVYYNKDTKELIINMEIEVLNLMCKKV